ncbi:MAG: NAD(P)-dependent oxidoreductase [Bacteroidales bacterium]|nr:NAD(P)-dependent oxidoreductase [Bacteroidales bacterium]
MKKILVTGAAGYIGSVLVRQLLQKGFFVKGFDILNFGGESLLGIYNNSNFEFVKGDIRDEVIMRQAIKDIDAVIHLAAIVGDPACARQPKIAEETNWIGSKMLFDICNSSTNIKNFIFASTCSNYGKASDNSILNEESPLKPVSLYAELKVKFENYLVNTPIKYKLTPTSLRFATVYGISPRMRFDLTVNEFIRDVTFNKELKIFGEQFWRPYCHVEDLARACVLVLESPYNIVDRNIFNVGSTKENYQKKMIADEILKFIPNAKITYIKKDEDPRDYCVNFDKIQKQLGFSISKIVPDGLREINNILRLGLITSPWSDIYKN